MSRKDDRIGGLIRAAEAAAGLLRATSLELEEMAEALPERGNRTRKVQLSQTARRLEAAADCLLAEAVGGDADSAGLVARVARAGLATAVLVVPGIVGGVSSGVAEGAVARFEQRSQEAAAALDQVDAQRAELVVADVYRLRDQVVETTYFPEFDAASPERLEGIRKAAESLRGGRDSAADLLPVILSHLAHLERVAIDLPEPDGSNMSERVQGLRDWAVEIGAELS